MFSYNLCDVAKGQFLKDTEAATLKGTSRWLSLFFYSVFCFPDPNTQILYACDSCGDKFLDASSLAQHVRIHTAQALVMFQADSDFYQYTTASDADSATTWQPTAEQVIQEGELIFHAQDGVAEGGGVVGETQEQDEGSGGVIDEEGREGGVVEAHIERSPEAAAEVEEGKEEGAECESQA